MTLKLREIEVAVIEAGTAEELAENVRAFMAAGGEREFVETRQVGELAVMILYTQ